MTFTDEEFQKLPSVFYAFKDINGRSYDPEPLTCAPLIYDLCNPHL